MRSVVVLSACVLFSGTGVTAEGWTVLAARWRSDANPFAESQVWEEHIWTEGWGEKEQFYPKYMRPAGSVHLILRNDSGKTDSLALASVNGKPLADVVSNEQNAGPVVWYLMESPQLPIDPKRPDDQELNIQKNVPPGEWVECTLRLRQAPKQQGNTVILSEAKNPDPSPRSG